MHGVRAHARGNSDSYHFTQTCSRIVNLLGVVAIGRMTLSACSTPAARAVRDQATTANHSRNYPTLPRAALGSQQDEVAGMKQAHRKIAVVGPHGSGQMKQALNPHIHRART